MGSKNFAEINLSNIWVTCGSDRIDWEVITAFVNKGATFMANWGMSEIGPCAINTVFSNIDYVKNYISLAPSNLTIIGENFYFLPPSYSSSLSFSLSIHSIEIS